MWYQLDVCFRQPASSLWGLEPTTSANVSEKRKIHYKAEKPVGWIHVKTKFHPRRWVSSVLPPVNAWLFKLSFVCMSALLKKAPSCLVLQLTNYQSLFSISPWIIRPINRQTPTTRRRLQAPSARGDVGKLFILSGCQNIHKLLQLCN